MTVAYSNLRLPEVKATGFIPRLVHQTYRSGDLPEPIKNNVAQLKSDNPDWDHCFYDDSDIERFITETYSTEIHSAYKRINPIYGAARADFFRYLLMYDHGGVYLDIKSSFSGPISDFIREDDQFVIGQWNNGKGEPYEGWGIWPEVGHVPGGEFQQWFMIAAPGHPFLRAAICAAVAKIENYDAWQDGVGFFGV